MAKPSRRDFPGAWPLGELVASSAGDGEHGLQHDERVGGVLLLCVGRVYLPLELHLAPGNYRLLFTDRGAARPVEFAIQSGQTTEVEAPDE